MQEAQDRIQPNEVRIGNLFIRELHNSRGLEYDHEFILTEYWLGQLFSDNTGIALQDLFPIPLSEDWLIRFGFRDELNANKTTTLYIHGILSLAKRENDEYSCAIHTILTYPLPTKIKYVHQLQNLIFALTKIELQTAISGINQKG